MIITIDGPAGSGKSTHARELARALGISYLDTGATYRAVTLKALRAGIDLTDEDALANVAREATITLRPHPDGLQVLLDGKDVSDEIRSPEVSAHSRYPAESAKVREILVDLQRRIGAELGRFVAEGRDQGTVVFPHADLKFYMIARPEVRAARRVEQLAAAGKTADYDEVLQAIRQRDHRDSTRAASPLTRPDDAVVIDTSDMTIQQIRDVLVQTVEART